MGEFLRRQTAGEVHMSFADIEHVTATRLPEKSQHSRAWWSNNAANNVMTKVWLDAGFESAAVDLKAHTVVFRRKARVRPAPVAGYGGMADEAVEYKDVQSPEKPPTRHPAWGAMKGQVSILPRSAASPEPLFSGGDLYTAEEWAEIEEEMQKDWDQIAEGMKGMAETARDYVANEGAQLPDHPIVGCMKGTFWIDPEWNPTQPALDPEELAQWEASIDRKFASLAQPKK